MTLKERLFVISIISIIFIVSFNYFYSRKIYKPYSTYDTKKWIYYVIRNGMAHIIVFNTPLPSSKNKGPVTSANVLKSAAYGNSVK